ncbi:MAG: TrmH family RNA methyltransferase [Planctomycetota bacterium]
MEHLEGRESVLAALGARLRKFEVVLLSDRAHKGKVKDVAAAAAAVGVPLKRVAPGELDAMAHGRTHGGVIAVCTPRPPHPEKHLLDRVERGGAVFLVLVEGVEDARHLGFVLRSAEAFGADAVLVKKHVWDFDGADVSRVSAGAYERLMLVRMDRESDLLAKVKKRGVRVFACVAGAKRAIHDADFRGPVLLALGGEKRGLSAAVREACDRFVSIPMQGEGTSLSLTDAAAVAMAEVARQRRGT